MLAGKPIAVLRGEAAGRVSVGLSSRHTNPSQLFSRKPCLPCEHTLGRCSAGSQDDAGRNGCSLTTTELVSAAGGSERYLPPSLPAGLCLSCSHLPRQTAELPVRSILCQLAPSPPPMPIEFHKIFRGSQLYERWSDRQEVISAPPRRSPAPNWLFSRPQ